MKKLLTILILLALASTTYAALTYDQDYYVKNRRSVLSGSSNDPLYNFIGEVEDLLEGTTAQDFFYLNPTTVPTAAEGVFYYNDSLDVIRLYTGSAWVSLEKGGDYASLDEAYDGGAAIAVDAGAIVLTASNAANNTILQLVQSDTGTSLGIDLNNAGTGNSIDIQAAQAGTDIEGTDDTWNVATTGVGTFLSFALENGETIKNDTNNEIEFAVPSGEDISFNLATSNTCTLATDSGLDSFAFGVVDDLEGVGSIVFDDAASTITLTSTGATDLTISQATADQDASLILQSSGTGADALSLIASAASINVDSADNLDIDVADNITVDTAGGTIAVVSIGGDITLDSTTKSVIIDGAEAVDDAINIDSAGGGLDVDVALSICLTTTESESDSVNIDSAGGVDIDISGGGAGEDFAVTTDTSITMTATENNAAAIHIEENGGTSGGINIYSNQGVGVAASTEHDASIQLQSDAGGIGLYTTANLGNAIRIETNGGADENIFIQAVKGTGADSITLTSTVGGIAVTANAAGKDVVLDSVLGSTTLIGSEDAASAISLTVDGGDSSTIKIHADKGTAVAENVASIQLLSDEGGISIQSDGDLDDAITIRADGGTTAEITIHNDQGTATDSIEIVSDDGGILIDSGGGAGDEITLTSYSSVVFTTGQTRKVTLSGVSDIVPDGGSAPATIGALGSNGTGKLWAWQFEADSGGDEIVHLFWNVPDGYIANSARLNVGWSYATAEVDDDDVVFDMTVEAIAQGTAGTAGEALYQAGAAFTEGDTNLDNADSDNNKLLVTQLNFEVEDIAVDDTVCIMFWVDASATDFADGVSVDVHFWEIEWESTE